MPAAVIDSRRSRAVVPAAATTMTTTAAFGEAWRRRQHRYTQAEQLEKSNSGHCRNRYHGVPAPLSTAKN